LGQAAPSAVFSVESPELELHAHNAQEKRKARAEFLVMTLPYGALRRLLEPKGGEALAMSV